jgi:hypothetical protein
MSRQNTQAHQAKIERLADRAFIAVPVIMGVLMMVALVTV